MPKVGIEPTRPEGHRILSPARRPVPPLRLASMVRAASPRRRGLQSPAGPGDTPRRAASHVTTPRITRTSGKSKGGRVKKRLLFAAVVTVALAIVAAGCGGSSKSSSGGGSTTGGGGGSASLGNVTSLPASSCQKLENKSGGDPDLLVVSDLPMQGSSRTQTVQMVQAIRYILDQQKWKAGKYNIAYQVCDDSTSQAGKWDSGKCNQNAQAYSGDKSVIAVIGTFNSGCAAIEIPVLNQAAGGAIAIVSPANTFPCLTVGAGCTKAEPKKYYPTGKRNYARVVPYDAYQAATLAHFMEEKGVTQL